MKAKYIIFFLLLAAFKPANGQSFTFNYHGTERSYVLHLPAGYDQSLQYPLVFNFHGLTQTGTQQQTTSGMDAVADEAGFIVVYPDGLNNSWNAGINNEDVDDVGFINALLDHLIATYSVDDRKVYSTGFSMGGYFSYRLACELSHRIAAIAPVSGLLATTVASTCNPSRDIPVLHFHGTNDQIVSYEGTYSLSVEETLAYWRENNECTSEAEITLYPDVNATDGSTVELIEYKTCASGSEVSHFKIHNEDHTWPGSSSWGANKDIIASREIWSFFSQYSLPDMVTSIVPVKDPQISVAPLPFSNSTVVSNTTGATITVVRIVDLSGNEVFLDLNPGRYEIELGETINSGIYFLQVTTETGVYNQKIIKQ